MAVAPTMPIPEMLLSRLLASSERCCATIRFSIDPHRLHRLKPRRQHDKARVSIDRQARILFTRNDPQQLLDPLTPLRISRTWWPSFVSSRAQ